MKNSVKLIIESVVPVQYTCTHGLLGHLALIHISWRLIVVQKGNMLRKDREEVCNGNLRMKTFWKINISRDLLKWS
jgi:hypothetical protein